MAQLSISGNGNALKRESIGGGRRVSQPVYGDDESFKLRKVNLGEGTPRYENFRPPEGAPPALNPMASAPRLTLPTSDLLSAVTTSALFEAEEQNNAMQQEVVVHGQGGQKNYNEKTYLRFPELADFSDSMDSARQNIKIASYTPDDLLNLKSIVFDIKSNFEQFDLARRLVSLKKLINQLKDDNKGIADFKLNGKEIINMIQLCDKILDVQGNCEPVDPKAGFFGEAPEHFTFCSPLLWLYRLLPRFVRQFFLDSGWSTIITLNEDSLADADMGINAMGIICALIMTVPFGLLGGASASFWDELRAAVATCPLQHPKFVNMQTGEPDYPANPNTWKDPISGEIWATTNYGWTYDGIRREFLAYTGGCIMMSLNCVVLSTIFYVFHRGGEKDPRKLHQWWNRKGYLFVVACGIFTIISIACLFALTKSIYVYYTINLGNIAPTLDDWWSRAGNSSQTIKPVGNDKGSGEQRIFYNKPGAFPPGDIKPFVSDVCVVNSLEFASPAAASLILTLFFGFWVVF